GARPDLMQLSVASLDPKAPPIQFKDLMCLGPPQAVDRISKVLDPVALVTPAAVFTHHDDVSRVRLRRATVESVAGRVTVPSHKQTFDAADCAACRNRDDVRHVPPPEPAQDRHRTETFVAIESLDTQAQSPRQLKQALQD